MGKPIVDFVIAGKPKCGTTALAHFLDQHPKICISKPKEPNYFATDHIKESDEFHGKRKYFPIRTESDYVRCFSHKRSGQICGEASPRYLNSKEAAKNIYEHNPQAKIIIMLRHPVDFMYSAHTQLLNANIEDESDFSKAIGLEEARSNNECIPKGARYPSHFLYTQRAKFYQEVKRYTDIFPRDNILVLTNEEFKASNEDSFKKVAQFLKIDEKITPEFKLVNASKVPRSRLLNNIFNSATMRKIIYKVFGPQAYTRISNFGRSIVLKDKKREPLSKELRAKLEKNIIEDVYKLSDLLERDFVKEWNMQRES